MSELPEHLGTEIDRLCTAGDELAEAEHFDEAVARYEAAWQLLPTPPYDWEAATWILTAIGDARYLQGGYAAAAEALSAAMHTPDAIGNPFIHLRLGESRFELGELDRAADELMRAYMGAGPEIFEDEDPKYLEFLATRADGIKLPGRKRRWWRR